MQSPAIIPFTITHRFPKEFYTLVAEALIVMAAFSAVIGGMWLFRWWVVRWVTMAYAAGRVLRVGIYYSAGVASGVGSGLSGSTQAILMVYCCIDLLIFGYLAFYPGVKLAFEKTY